jgi:hypothetical protein
VEIHAIIDGYIEEEIEHQKHARELGSSSDTTSEPSAYKYVLLRELIKHSDDKLYIRNELMNVFFAARDTVGTVIGNMLFLLVRHAEVWQKLRKEVAAIAPQQELTFEFLKSLKYIQAVIEESKLTWCPSLSLSTNIFSPSTYTSRRSKLEDMSIHLYPPSRWWEGRTRSNPTTTRRPNRARLQKYA